MDQLAPDFRYYAPFWSKYIRNRIKNRRFEIKVFLSRNLKGSGCFFQNQDKRYRIKLGNTLAKRERKIRIFHEILLINSV